LDCVAKGRHPQANKTHCPRGHEYTAATTYVRPDGKGTFCRVCARERKRAKAVN
jgi:hypothetical protein